MDALISQIYFWYKTPTCFGQFLCPSLGVFHCTHSNGICHTEISQMSEMGKILPKCHTEISHMGKILPICEISVRHIPLLCVK